MTSVILTEVPLLLTRSTSFDSSKETVAKVNSLDNLACKIVQTMQKG